MPQARHTRSESELLGEELERGAGLRLLLTAQVDAAVGEEPACLERDVERLGRRALRRELQDPRVIGVQPELADELAVVALRDQVDLEHRDRAENREIVELDALGGMFVEERAL